jgi:hypothetical protein
LGCWYRDANERFFSKIGVFNEMRVILQKKWNTGCRPVFNDQISI